MVVGEDHTILRKGIQVRCVRDSVARRLETDIIEAQIIRNDDENLQQQPKPNRQSRQVAAASKSSSIIISSSGAFPRRNHGRLAWQLGQLVRVVVASTRTDRGGVSAALQVVRGIGAYGLVQSRHDSMAGGTCAPRQSGRADPGSPPLAREARCLA